MPIFVCGINHKTAPVALREQVVFPQEKLPLYLHDLTTQENIREAVILSTCNRSELYCYTDTTEKAIQWFCRQHQLSSVELMPVLYFYQDKQAIEHIMQVACGLDSMMLGESQILGQMKAAYSESCAADAVGPLFNRLFQQVFSVAKEIRNNTAIGACPVSVSSAAVHFAKCLFPGHFEQGAILLVGAGLTMDLVLRHLKTSEPQSILIANRSKENAEKLAHKYRATVVDFKHLPQALSKADILITATGGAFPIITKSMIMPRKKLLYVIDIAVPRDVEIEVAACEGVQLYSIDDLKTSMQQHLNSREHAAEKAREMIKQKSQDFILWLNSLDMVNLTICAYRKKMEDLCQEELVKALQQLHRGEDSEQVLAQFAYALTNKLLHTPSVQLREAGFAGRLDLLQWARQLFAIPEKGIMKPSINKKLQALTERHEEVGALLADLSVIMDQNRFRELSKEYAQLDPVVHLFNRYQRVTQDFTEAKELLEEPDAEMQTLAKIEIKNAEEQLQKIEEALQILLLPRDPNDDSNIFLEIRAGAGGDEASIFAGDLYRMYTRYAQIRGWQVEQISASHGEHGGYKEIIARVIGQGAYSLFKFESGVHRVQRVPETEAQGRVHTSTCTIAILPEVDEIESIDINPVDLRVDTFRASGAGGQHVQKTDSAIRITHLPTGTVVECQDERSQHKNRARAMSLLKAKLLAAERSKQQQQQAEARRSLVGTGDRSERIRTYNFPQGRLTDHRINLTLYQLPDVMEGHLNPVIDALVHEYQADLLAQLGD